MKLSKVINRNPDISAVEILICPLPGVIRENCTYMPAWQSYKCFGLNYRLLAIESMDADTETRRLSPVAILGDGFVDLINGRSESSPPGGATQGLKLLNFVLRFNVLRAHFVTSLMFIIEWI